jgi:ABC-type branched-subunit amino acid transport system substrate-binding protein
MNRHLKGGANIHRAVAALIRRRCLWPALALPLVLGLAACGGGGGTAGPGSKRLDLVIGNSLPLSGSSQAVGESGAKASQLALAQIKQAIEAVGADHTVKIVSDDQGGDSSTATESARKLVGEDRASCLTGPWSSDAVAQTAHDVVIPGKVLEIAPVPTGGDVTDLNDHDLVNSTALPESVEGMALSKAIEEALGGAQGKSVSIASSSGGYGESLSQDVIADWQDKDGTVSEQTALSPQPLTTSSAYSGLAYQITSGSPDAILLIDDLTGFSELAPALASTDSWDPSTAWGSDRLVSPGLPGLVGAGSIDGMRALAPGAPSNEESASAFADEFKAREQRANQAPFAAQEFDATVLCYLAAVAAGSTDGQQMADHLIDITAPGGDEFSWQQLPEAIKALEDGKDIDYTGASGPIDMDVHGDPTAGVFDVYQYRGDSLDVVGQVSVKKPNPAIP